MAKVLKLVFNENNANKSRTITIQNPISSLTAEQVHGATDKSRKFSRHPRIYAAETNHARWHKRPQGD